MRRAPLVILASVLLIAAGGLYVYTMRGSEPQPAVVLASGNPVVGNISSDTDTYDVIVHFDGEAFSPKELAIEAGTRVRFLNDSDTDVWPASAVHPTHSVYPEKAEENCLGSSFDACRGLKKGEFFDFTFEHAGEWRYHDHIRAYKTGTVIVSG